MGSNQSTSNHGLLEIFTNEFLSLKFIDDLLVVDPDDNPNDDDYIPQSMEGWKFKYELEKMRKRQNRLFRGSLGSNELRHGDGELLSSMGRRDMLSHDETVNLSKNTEGAQCIDDFTDLFETSQLKERFMFPKRFSGY